MSGSGEAAMNARQRHTIVILVVVLISLTVLAAPARGNDWFGVGVGGDGFSLSANDSIVTNNFAGWNNGSGLGFGGYGVVSFNHCASNSATGREKLCTAWK